MSVKRFFKMRPFTWVLVGILGFMLFAFVSTNVMFATPFYSGTPSDHFDGKHFFNQQRVEKRSLTKFIRWLWSRRPGAWLPWMDAPKNQPPPAYVGEGELRVTYINHSTVLIQIGGLNILTDPIWSERISPVSHIGPKRHRPPGIPFDKLPNIDVVLITHNHYDHLDMPTVRLLARRFRPVFYTGLGNKNLLVREGISRVVELDWWKSASIDGLYGKIAFTFVPARHFSGRSFIDHDRSLWGGFVIEDPGGVIYFSGDTGRELNFGEIKKRFGPPRLAIFPIGAFKPRWFMSPYHLSPEEAVDVHSLLGAKTSLAVHFGTFKLGNDGQFEAAIDLMGALRKRDISPVDFWVLDFGQGRYVK